MTGTTIDNLLAAEKMARDRIAAAEQERARAADDRALAIADLADAIGPTDTARRLETSLSTVQKFRDRAKLVRLQRAQN